MRIRNLAGACLARKGREATEGKVVDGASNVSAAG